MTFPSESVPDGAVFGPHHLYVGLAVVALVVWVVADDYRHREPLLVAVGAVTAVFGFALTWPYYPAVGALLSLTGLSVALIGLLLPGGIWTSYHWLARGSALAGVAIAADDVLEHALGLWTPLDAVFEHVIYPVIA